MAGPQAENTPLTARGKRPSTSPALSDATKKVRAREPEAWQTLTRRKQKKIVEKENILHTEVGDQKRSKQKMKKQKNKSKPQHRWRLDPMLVKPTAGKSYSEVLRELKKSVKPEEAEVTIRSVKKTKDGSLLLELQNGGNRNQFYEAVRQSLKEAAKVIELKPKKTIEIRDLDSLVEQEEIVDAIKDTAQTSDVDITVRVSNKNSREQCRAFVTITDDIANVILKSQRIKIGWTYCRVRQANDIKRCFRCFGVGHTQMLCRGPDRNGQGLCIRCGTAGHNMKDCSNTPRCCICTERGIGQTDHVPGSNRCTAYKTFTER